MNEYKGFLIESDGTFSMRKIKPIGKGSVPMVLRGSYTNTAFAMQAIDAYKDGSDGKAKQSN